MMKKIKSGALGAMWYVLEKAASTRMADVLWQQFMKRLDEQANKERVEELIVSALEKAFPEEEKPPVVLN